MKIETETNRIILSPLFQMYDPFTNKIYSDVVLKSDIHFDFEENDDGDFTCVAHNADSPSPIFNHEEISALEKDLAIVYKIIANGMSFAFMNVISHPYEAMQIAKDLGHRCGKNEAQWICQDTIGGRASGNLRDKAKKILKMYDDGDPQFYDMIPQSPLSGEWADDYSAKEIICDSLKLDDSEFTDLREHCEAMDIEGDFDSTIESICNAYQDAFQESCIDEIISQCKSTIS
jgi:hypothetical protein